MFNSMLTAFVRSHAEPIAPLGVYDQLPLAHCADGESSSVRYAESGRVNWCRNFATHFDPENRQGWIDSLSSRGTGLILRSIKIDYKFVKKPLTCDKRSSLLTGNCPAHDMARSRVCLP